MGKKLPVVTTFLLPGDAYSWHKNLAIMVMANDKKILEEQEAPLKNNDHAFVQVGKDGHPVFPQPAADKKDETNRPDKDTSLDRR